MGLSCIDEYQQSVHRYEVDEVVFQAWLVGFQSDLGLVDGVAYLL